MSHFIGTRRTGGNAGPNRPSFTLVELLVTISILAMLSATALFMLFGVEEHARLARTKSSIARVHSVIMEQWESYLTRPVPVRIVPADTLDLAAAKRLNGMRELLRMQLPDRKSDLLDNPVVLRQPGTANPLLESRFQSFRRRADRMVRAARGMAAVWTDDTSGWTRQHQGAECLYLILGSIRDGDRTALDYFLESELGDLDGDGMREVLDGWGRPIEFLRWAPGFVTIPGLDGAWGTIAVDDDGNGSIDDELEAGSPGTDDGTELQTRNSAEAPDPFDPRGIDARMRVALSLPPNPTFALIPLIYSAGPDGVYDLLSDDAPPVRYSATSPPNDPFVRLTIGSRTYQLGQPVDAGSPDDPGVPNGVLDCWDNITNHLLQSK